MKKVPQRYFVRKADPEKIRRNYGNRKRKTPAIKEVNFSHKCQRCLGTGIIGEFLFGLPLSPESCCYNCGGEGFLPV
ncbi:MAG TPA: hypothetical protein PLK35_03290 [Candidatus Moranbacteria bacterium]|nr:hypothetical protein [Candidatus Moranbacteria bacterium]